MVYLAEEAMKRRCAQLQAAMTEGTLADLAELKALGALSWMLTAEQKSQQATWVEELFRRKGMAKGPDPVRAKAVGGRGGISASTGGSKNAVAKQSASSTMDIFKKRRTT